MMEKRSVIQDGVRKEERTNHRAIWKNFFLQIPIKIFCLDFVMVQFGSVA